MAGMKDLHEESGDTPRSLGNLEPLFRPRAVAVVGASDDATKYGHKVLRNILDGDFQGAIYPVNPYADVVMGLKSYESLRHVPQPLDLACIVIPAEHVSSAVKDAIATGVRSLVIITAGFGETGPEGMARQTDIGTLCTQAGLPAVGPNCMGICNFSHRLSATMETLHSTPGNVSFISQSGTYGISTLNYGLRMGVAFNVFVSSGNEAVSRFADYLEFLGQDTETRVIMGYIESLRDARKFRQVAAEVTKRKPVVVMKFGRTNKGSMAAASHTGALAGSHSIYAAMFRQCGVLEVTRTQDLLNVARALSTQPPLKGPGIGVVGASGGFAVAVTDYLEEQGLEVPVLSEDVQQQMRREAGTMPYASVRNPVDLAADLRPTVLLKCADIAARQDCINGLIVALPSRPFPPARETIDEIERIQRVSGKPVLICYYARPEGIDTIQAMTRLIPVYRSPEEVGQVMACLWQYGDYLSRHP
ncbi:MAG: CoA-binding protein [Dehalococcoidia bacterium]|nr:CoA-binding protein [Dehalococcoidia bacterium]